MEKCGAVVRTPERLWRTGDATLDSIADYFGKLGYGFAQRELHAEERYSYRRRYCNSHQQRQCGKPSSSPRLTLRPLRREVPSDQRVSAA
jgi:hypothetical protein